MKKARSNAPTRESIFFYTIGRANTGKSSLFNAVVGRKSLLMASKRAVSHVNNLKIVQLNNKNFNSRDAREHWTSTM